MPTEPFQPRFMKIGILTAAFQELTPREVRDGDPDRAIEDWAVFASEVGVPPEAMLDPVANTLDLRRPFDTRRSQRVEAALILLFALRPEAVERATALTTHR